MKTLPGNLTIKKTSISLTLLYLPSMFKLIQEFSDFKGYLLCGIATLVRLVVHINENTLVCVVYTYC